MTENDASVGARRDKVLRAQKNTKTFKSLIVFLEDLSKTELSLSL